MNSVADDAIGKRFSERQKKHKLDDLGKKARSKEDLEAEQELIEKTEKVDPLKAADAPGRNDPCPCGSGKKYKRCCGAK